MKLTTVRRIRGNIHGTIDVTALEDHVIGHRYFQRLRRIRQLAFLHYVFPGATHTRFEHSLGVMHLAGVAWTKMEVNQRRLEQTVAEYQDFSSLERSPAETDLHHGLLAPTFSLSAELFQSGEILQTLRLAALLHDIGHPPYSHSGEIFLPEIDAIRAENPDLPAYLQEFLAGLAREQHNRPVKMRHEIYSVLLIDRLLRDIQASQPDLMTHIDPQDVACLVSHHIPVREDSPIAKWGAHHICRELISGELDIDRMDYLIRDSRECGVVYGIFDVNRIIDSLCLYFDPNQQQMHVAILLSGLAAFDDYLRARHSMYLQLYFHKTSVAAEAMLRRLKSMLSDLRLPAKLEDYADVDEYNMSNFLRTAAISLPDADRRRFEETVRKLFFDRVLWKRIYETSTVHDGELNIQDIDRTKEFLEQRGIDYEYLTTGTLLTRFRPRNPNEPSATYLRLIKKDSKLVPRVYPIEDYSTSVSHNRVAAIHRIYADQSLPGSDSKSLRRDLAKLISTDM